MRDPLGTSKIEEEQVEENLRKNLPNQNTVETLWSMMQKSACVETMIELMSLKARKRWYMR